MTDSKKHITATDYGRANLPWVVFKDDKRIEYLYDAADQRIGKHIGDDRAATLSEEYYIRAGGLELAVYDYTQDEITWYLHGTEREAKATTPAPADFIDDSRTAQPGLPALRWSFYLSDHLGNTRIVFSASCESHAVVYNYEFVADYTPYGRILRSSGREKYQTTQHERDAETDLDYRGARFYDSDAARFLSLDPLAAKYLALGAYVYVAGNPVRYSDPTGREIRVFYGEGDDDYVTYKNGSFYNKDGTVFEYKQGQYKFLDDVLTTINYLSSSRTATELLNELANADDFIVELINSESSTVYSYNNDGSDRYAKIYFNPYSPTLFAGPNFSVLAQNPAIGFIHEFDHAYINYLLYQNSKKSGCSEDQRDIYESYRKTIRKTGDLYEDTEEERVIYSSLFGLILLVLLPNFQIVGNQANTHAPRLSNYSATSIQGVETTVIKELLQSGKPNDGLNVRQTHLNFFEEYKTAGPTTVKPATPKIKRN